MQTAVGNGKGTARAAVEAAWWAVRRWPGLAIIPGVFFVAAAFGQAATQGPVLCFFRRITGMPCAGCGMTRAFVALGHFELGAAVDFNPLSPAAFAWMAIWWLLATVALLRGRAVPVHPRWLLKIGLLTLTGWWVLRTVLFLAAPGAWAQMTEVSPIMAAVDLLL